MNDIKRVLLKFENKLLKSSNLVDEYKTFLKLIFNILITLIPKWFEVLTWLTIVGLLKYISFFTSYTIIERLLSFSLMLILLYVLFFIFKYEYQVITLVTKDKLILSSVFLLSFFIILFISQEIYNITESIAIASGQPIKLEYTK